MKKNELIEFFTKNNSSGYKTKENILKEKYPDIYQDVINYSNSLPFHLKLSFKEKIWYFINNCSAKPLCPICQTPIKFGRSIQEGYNKYCSLKCTNASKEHKKNVKTTNNIKYGGNSPSSSKSVIEKIEKTMFERHGVKNAMQLNTVKEQFKNGTLKKYGVPYFFQSDQHTQRSPIKYKNIGLVKTNHGVFTIWCPKCNKEQNIDINLFYYRKRNNINLCPKCVPIKTFAKQTELYNFVQSLLPNEYVMKNVRSIIKPKEIDVYIPSRKIGFELNGLYWHSSLFNLPTDHQDKQEKAELNNIKLFQIFEDEWDNKKPIIKSMIQNTLGLNNIKIYARKCVVKPISSQIATNFLQESHLQGYAYCKIKLGLFFEEQLISVMTFNKPRIISGGWNKHINVFEIIRFATKLNTTVIGGAGKLLNYFVYTYKPSKLISYADRRFSTGNLYRKLGFIFKHYTQPNYYYIINNKRIHRFNFNKQKLIKLGYDPLKTERQIMEENHIYKIFDCGSLLFEKIF